MNLKKIKRNLEIRLRHMNGIDGYSFFGLLLSLILIGINLKIKSKALTFFVLVGIIYFGIYRVFSTRRIKRQRENDKYKSIVSPLSDYFSYYVNKFKNRKYYKYIRCPECIQELKLAKNKGKVLVTCPHCGHKFERET